MINYAKFSGHYFYMKLNVYWNFQICIGASVAFYTKTQSYQDMLHFVLLCLCVPVSLFSNLIFIVIDLVISIKQLHLFIWATLSKV